MHDGKKVKTFNTSTLSSSYKGSTHNTTHIRFGVLLFRRWFHLAFDAKKICDIFMRLISFY